MAVDPKIKILLVEDATTMRKMEIKILKQLGFENILEAVDGDDAIAKIESDSDIKIIISQAISVSVSSRQYFLPPK